MEKQTATFGIQVAVGPDTDAEEVAVATLQLRRELLDLDVDAVEPAGGDRSRAAGLGAAAGVALLVFGLSPGYQSDDPLSVVAPGAARSVMVIAALAFLASACTFLPRTRRSIGPGLLLGTTAASTWGLLGLAGEWLMEDGFGSAFGVGLAAYSVLLLAGCLAGLALVRTGEVRLGGGPAQHKLAWPVVLVGAAGALALILLAGALSEYGATYGAVLPVQWAAVLAVLVPAGAAVAVPRQFGVSVLVSWIGTAAAIGWYYSWLLEKETDLGSTLIPVLGATLLALLVLAVLMARAAPATGEDGATA